MIVAWFLSSGEPICEGPLILAGDDSSPPQCDSPVHGLGQVGLTLFVAGLIPLTIGAAGVLTWRKIRGRTDLNAAATNSPG